MSEADRRSLKHKLDALTETVTEIGHWNNEPAGSYEHRRFYEAADELADALYDAWMDGLLMVRPAGWGEGGKDE